MRTSVSVTLFAAALCSSTLTSAAPPTTYRVTEFGGNDSATPFTTVNGVNNLGQATIGVYTYGPDNKLLPDVKYQTGKI